MAHVGGTISSLDGWMDMQGHVRGLAGSFVYKTGGQFVRLSCNFNRLKGIPHRFLRSSFSGSGCQTKYNRRLQLLAIEQAEFSAKFHFFRVDFGLEIRKILLEKDAKLVKMCSEVIF